MSDETRTGVDFPAGLIEPRAWRIKGVGMHGSDVDVVSLDSYNELAALYKSAHSACLMWGRKCIELEGDRKASADFDEKGLALIAESLRLPLAAVLSALAAPSEGDRP